MVATGLQTLPLRVDHLLDYVELLRVEATRQLTDERRAARGQYFTPAPVSQLMASMFTWGEPRLRLLDAGAGMGSLSAAFVAEMVRQPIKPRSLNITAYEIEPGLVEYLRMTLDACAGVCASSGVAFESQIVTGDFIAEGVAALKALPLLTDTAPRFNRAILNPPYHKIQSASRERQMLRAVGIETSNLYAAFVWLAMRLLESPNSELVTITPRSFCNGPYFQPFRTALLDTFSLRRLHVFDSRTAAFRDDEVLQENIIWHGVRSDVRETVIVSTSAGPNAAAGTSRAVPYDQVVTPGDRRAFIHIVADEDGHAISRQMRELRTALDDLGLEVSTGRVVDFRARDWLKDKPEHHTAPLIYPANFDQGFIAWPVETRKPQAIVVDAATADLLIPSACYVLVKRFSSKEERRRVVAAVHDRSEAALVGFENHLNYFHARGGGLPIDLAKGLAAFLNSTLLDLFFRQFSGHTQVNAADLRNLRYPTREQLVTIGRQIGRRFPAQAALDQLIQEALKPDGIDD